VDLKSQAVKAAVKPGTTSSSSGSSLTDNGERMYHSITSLSVTSSSATDCRLVRRLDVEVLEWRTQADQSRRFVGESGHRGGADVSGPLQTCCIFRPTVYCLLQIDSLVSNWQRRKMSDEKSLQLLVNVSGGYETSGRSRRNDWPNWPRFT